MRDERQCHVKLTVLERKKNKPLGWRRALGVSIGGEGERAYLSDRGISSGRDHTSRKWICSKPESYLQHLKVSKLVSKQS